MSFCSLTVIKKTFKDRCQVLHFLCLLFPFPGRLCLHQVLKNDWGGFPGDAVVKNLPANAGDTGSCHGLGRSHMPGSNWAREPQLLSLHVWSLCSATREAATVRGPCTAMKSGPRLPQLEKAFTQKRRPNTAIKINKINKFKNDLTHMSFSLFNKLLLSV